MVRSNRINETTLYFIEHQDSQDQNNECQRSRIAEHAPCERSMAKESDPEGLDYCGHGVVLNYPNQDRVFAAKFLDNGRKRIYHRGRIHQQLNAKQNEKCQVTIPGGHSRNDHPQAKPLKSHQQYHNGE